jgi:hypothetical protein
VSEQDQARQAGPVRAGTAMQALLAGMPPRLRLVAAGGKLTAEQEAMRDRLDAEADAAAVAQRLAAQAMFRQRSWEAACPERYRAATVAGLVPQQDPGGVVSGWLASPSLLLVLHGPSRRGKTHSAWAVASQARDGGAWVSGGRVADLMWLLRPNDADPGRPERTRSALFTAGLAVLDDLGREPVTPTVVAHVWDTLETRLSGGLRTIVTTNLTTTELLERYGDPVLYRLTETGTAARIVGDVLHPDMG